MLVDMYCRRGDRLVRLDTAYGGGARVEAGALDIDEDGFLFYDENFTGGAVFSVTAQGMLEVDNG